MGLILKAIKSKQRNYRCHLMVMVLLLISSVLMYFIETPINQMAFQVLRPVCGGVLPL